MNRYQNEIATLQAVSLQGAILPKVRGTAQYKEGGFVTLPRRLQEWHRHLWRRTPPAGG